MDIDIQVMPEKEIKSIMGYKHHDFGFTHIPTY